MGIRAAGEEVNEIQDFCRALTGAAGSRLCLEKCLGFYY